MGNTKTVTNATLNPEKAAGINKHHRKFSFRTFLESQKRLGITKIELWCGVPHVFLDGQTPVDAKELKKAMAEYDISPIALTCPSVMYQYQYAPLKEHRKASRDYFAQGLRLASDLECPVVTLNSGWGLLDEPEGEAWARCRDLVGELAQLAGSLGVVMAMEPLRRDNSDVVVDLASLAKMRREINNPALKVTADIGSIYWAGETLEEWFEAFGEDIVHMHFTDARPGEISHVVWGEGNLPLTSLLETMEKYDYRGYLVQEFGGFGYLNEPVKYDRKNLAALGVLK